MSETQKVQSLSLGTLPDRKPLYLYRADMYSGEIVPMAAFRNEQEGDIFLASLEQQGVAVGWGDEPPSRCLDCNTPLIRLWNWTRGPINKGWKVCRSCNTGRKRTWRDDHDC